MFESEFYWTKYHTDKNVVASGEYLDHLLTRIQQAIENAKDMNVTIALFINCGIQKFSF